VPLGTVVRDKETGEVLFEITEDGEVLSRGGKFLELALRSATKPNPRYAQPGLPGSEMDAILELKF
jgi:GTP-binding protein